jgi:hypothetical protein
MTEDELELAFLEAVGKCLQERLAELERQIIAAPPEDRWGEKHYALVVGDKVIVQEIKET